MATKQFGPFSVVGLDVPTGVQVQAGDTVRTVSDGIVDFGGAVGGLGAPKLNADGDSEPAPKGYPAEALRKNSLIAKVGARWYQGGTDKTFTPSENGEIILRTNDAITEDNSRGWAVTLYVTSAESQPQPQPQPQPQQPQSTPMPASSSQCCCGDQYYHTPPWWVTLPPWWLTMTYRPPSTGSAPMPGPDIATHQ